MTHLDPTRLASMSRFVADRMGLSFPTDRWPELARALGAACRELGLEREEATERWGATQTATAAELETLARHLTVAETWFYRDPDVFEALERHILPALVARRAGGSRVLRLWSAGCCTGEEPYSLAIACLRAVPDLATWSLSVLGTDLNRTSLAKARAGVYSAWSFRGAPAWLRSGYFEEAPNKKLQLHPAVLKRVHFATLNLIDDAWPSPETQTHAMDVIFCRNVLMYLTPAHQARVVAALRRALVDGGVLVLNPVEANAAFLTGFVVETLGQANVYRRLPLPAGAAAHRGGPPTAPEPPPAAEPPLWLAPAPPVKLLDLPAPTLPPQDTGPAPPPSQDARPEGDALTRARAAADQGSLDEAARACRDVLATDRTNIEAHFLYASVCDELGRPDEALAVLGRVLYLDQDFVLAHHAISTLCERLGRRKEAARHLAITRELLARHARDDVLPGSGGMTCGRLLASVRAPRGG